MPAIQTRVFWRLSNPDANAIGIALGSLEAEVNTFAASFAFGDILDIRYNSHAAGKYGYQLLLTASVYYVDT